MELSYMLNYLVFAAFFCLFVIETGIGILALMDYRRYRTEIRRYLLPTWSIDGTFAVFYIVNFIATYPTLVGTIYIYVVPLLIGSIFFLLRSAFIAYSEYIDDLDEETRYMEVYGVATIVTSFIAISILSSGVSGIGVNLQGQSIDIVQVLANPFNALIFVGVALIALFTAVNYFKVKRLETESYLFLPAAALLVVGALWLYVPYMYQAIAGNYALIAISAVLMALALILKRMDSWVASYFGMFWLFVSVNLFGLVQYPYLFGGNVSFAANLNNSAMGQDVTAITFVGGFLLVLALSFFLYVDFVKKKPRK